MAPRLAEIYGVSRVTVRRALDFAAELRRNLHAVVSLSEVEDVFASYLANPHRHEDALA